jgi:UDP-GlcNAc:undecaprenyl-phosphate GlcNAc-1-phosphate transferase
MILQYFLPLFWAILTTLAITPVAVRVAIHFRLLDHPYIQPHKIHHQPTPKGGGIACAAGLYALNFLLGNTQSTVIRAILAAAILIFLFGLLDDIYKLSPAWKLFGQVVGTSILISQGIYVHMLGNLMVANVALTFLWVIGITNALNFVDSTDGLAVGLVAIASTFFLLVTIDAGQPFLSLLSTILLGICLGLLFFNVSPAQTFLGDSGSQFLGFILAALAIAYTPPGLPQPSSWFVPILLLSVPIFDTALVVITRVKQNRPVYQAGLDHTYHRLIGLGMPPSRAVMTMHLASILCGCLAFIALPLPPLRANLIFVIAIVAGFFILTWFTSKVSK